MRLNLSCSLPLLLVCASALPFFPARSLARQSIPAGSQAPGASSSPASPSNSPAVAAPASPKDPDAPAPSALEQGLVSFYEQGFEAAASRFTQASASPGIEGARAYAWLARTDLHLHNLDDADKAAHKAIELAPTLPASQSALAEVYFRQAKFADAEQTLHNLLATKNPDARAFLTFARIYWATANYKAAKSCIDLARRMDPLDPDIEMEWADTLPRSQRLEEWKKRLAKGGYEDEEQRVGLQAEISMLEDQEHQPQHTCKLTTKSLPAEIKLESLLFDAKHLRGYGLQVRVNDASSKLLLDTGSFGILINSKIAQRAGVTKIADMHISGIGDRGPAGGFLGFAKKLQIGSLIFEDCFVDVIDKKSSLGEDGLIGADIFADFLVDLDFPNARLRLSELPPFPDEPATIPGLQMSQPEKNPLHNRWIPPQFSSYERVYRFGHILLIPGFINDSPPKLFMVDTGGWDNFITPAAAKGYTKIYSDSDTEVKGLSGKVKKVYSTGAVTLVFGHFKQFRLDLVAFDLTHTSDNLGTEVAGSLGFAMLYMLEIKIDYRDHLMDFFYDPNRFH
ncbi:MAG TPA: aspartyl protease family protein [Candidatus Acidoferrum sp.]|nr:aspartyl protease family protein [Candidatus Acidoferrum sp.]